MPWMEGGLQWKGGDAERPGPSRVRGGRTAGVECEGRAVVGRSGRAAGHK